MMLYRAFDGFWSAVFIIRAMSESAINDSTFLLSNTLFILLSTSRNPRHSAEFRYMFLDTE